MKKILGIIVAVVFAILLFANVNIGINADKSNDIKLDNLEALACYSLEIDNVYIWDCCSPWDPLCSAYVVYLYGTITY